MPENRLRTRLDAGDVAIQVMCHVPSVFLADQVGRLGYDSVLLDMQHGPFGFDSLYELVTVLGNSCPMVRVPSKDFGTLEKAADTGVYGVICPDVNTRAEAEMFVEAVKWAKSGDCVTIAQIESVEGFNNLEEIASTPGLYAIWPGPNDLSRSFGEGSGLNYDKPSQVERLKRILDVTRDNGLKRVMISGGMTETCLELGADWLIVGPEFAWTLRGGAQTLAETRGLIEKRAAEPAPA